MMLRPGQQLRSTVCAVQVDVARAPAGAVGLACGGPVMLEVGVEPTEERAVDPSLGDGASLDADEVQAFVRQSLRGTKRLQIIRFTAALPYTETGKLLRPDRGQPRRRDLTRHTRNTRRPRWRSTTWCW